MTYFILVPDNLNQAGLDILDTVQNFEICAPGKMNRADTLAQAPKAHAMIVRSGTTVDAEMIETAVNLKIVVRAGVGVDNVDLDACTARGIVVMNTPDANTVSTAEFALGLILALARHIPQADRSLREGQWARKTFVGTELNGKTLGIIGFGRVGRALAQRAKCLGLHEIAYDPFVPEDVARHLGLSLVPRLDELLEVADIISLHAVVTDDTRELIDAAAIAKMKDGVMLINAARGALVNSADLATALKSGKVAGAAVDVYDVEPPPPDNPLLNLPNVIHTPHLGASTREAQDVVGAHAAETVINALIKKRYDNVRNRAVLAKLT
jgi:D-3-phosphoglycerate dehydrogenase